MAATPFEKSELLSLLSSATTDFTIDLYRDLVLADQTKNIFISPISISIIMGMTYMGARNNTAEQMKKVLKLKNMENTVHAAFEEYITLLKKAQANFILKTANRLYAHNKKTFLENYLSNSKKQYQAEIIPCDFVDNANGIRQEINQWVESETAQKIKDLIGEGVLTVDTVLVLVNAIYFKGDWASKFDAKNTKESPFSVNKEEQTTVNMMFQKEKFNYGHISELRASVLELPYVDKQLSMFVILPDETEGLEFVEQTITADMLSSISKSLRSVKVNVYLPKFKLEESFDLSGTLSDLGMSDLFKEGKADLSGIDGTNLLFVSKVIHKAFIDVNEEGSEAAAATAAVIMTRMIERTPDFKADHPFLFFIRDNRSDAILFIGKVMKPPLSTSDD